MVEDILIGLLCASCEGNGNLHLHAVRNMIPWCFAYYKLNYARYMSPYYAQMTHLLEKNPRVYEAFTAGRFSVQMSNNNPFGRIPVDQVTDVTVNKDTQTPGGTARFSLKAEAIKRYYITSGYRSAFLGQLRDMVQGNRSHVCYTELQRSRIHRALPPQEEFYSRLMKENISDDDYARCQAVWRDNRMKTMRDFLMWYNNRDVKPFLEAIDKQFAFYKQQNIDIFKYGVSVPVSRFEFTP